MGSYFLKAKLQMSSSGASFAYFYEVAIVINYYLNLLLAHIFPLP